jgi:hypothetical protein
MHSSLLRRFDLAAGFCDFFLGSTTAVDELLSIFRLSNVGKLDLDPDSQTVSQIWNF